MESRSIVCTNKLVSYAYYAYNLSIKLLKDDILIELLTLSAKSHVILWFLYYKLIKLCKTKY